MLGSRLEEYEMLDPELEAHVILEHSLEELVARGCQLAARVQLEHSLGEYVIRRWAKRWEN